MRIIAVMSPKGGIGKTTTSDAIAYMLGEEQEKRVLILDGDPQGDTSKTFEAYEPEGTGMSELLERHVSVGGSYRTKSLKDVIEEEQRLKACLERMKMDGKKIKGYDLQSGRLRDVIASMLKMSKTKIAQIESVNNNLIP